MSLSTLIYRNLEINTDNDFEQVQPDLWTDTSDANAYIDKLYNHYADLVDLAVPTHISPTVVFHPPEVPSFSKRPAHYDFSDSFYDLSYWNSVDSELTHQLIGKSLSIIFGRHQRIANDGSTHWIGGEVMKHNILCFHD